MKVTIAGNACRVVRESGDKAFRNTDWGRGESTLLYHMKQKLAEQGLDLIKKRMWKDGHLVDDDKLYLRARKLPVKSGEIECIHDHLWALRDSAEEYNNKEIVEFAVVRAD